MIEIPFEDPRAIEVTAAIHLGDVATLETLLERDSALATARIVDGRQVGRTLLHVLADWPGHRPESARTVKLLVRYGADVNAAVRHPDREEAAETPLHWAASNDDVPLIDALLDSGADIEASGAIFTGGAPMSDAVIFAQWKAARRLLERGAKTTFWQAAALGLLEEVKKHRALPADEITNAFWNACRGGQRGVAEYLLSQGADRNWVGHDDKTPLDVAQESENEELIAWLRDQGALPASQCGSIFNTRSSSSVTGS
jgi:ankyrin repeat protein